MLPANRRLRFNPLLAAASQARQQPRIPPLRSVIMHRDAQRLLLPDQHNQLLAPRDPRIDQVALQQHVVLRGERDHHGWKLRPLGFMDGDRIGKRNLVQFPEVVLRAALLEVDRDLMFGEVDALDGSDIAVAHLLVVVVLGLYHLVPHPEPPPEPLDYGLSRLHWIQRLLERGVQFAHSERSSVHGAKNLNIADGIECEALRNSLLHQLDERGGDFLWLVPLDEVEIRVPPCAMYVRHLSAADAVGAGDDAAIRRLPEDFREPDGRHDAALDQIMQRRARPNGWKLVYVADQYQPGVVRHRPQ